MNLEIANRLLALRREHGYSQEELAYKLGVSRQAVSKWERAESSPDTDNLLALARLYGVSLDALLLHTPAGEAAQAAPEPEEAPADEDAEIFAAARAWDAAEEAEQKARKRARAKWKEGLLWLLTLALMVILPNLTYWLGISEVYAVVVTVAFLITGFLLDNWHPGWMLFLTIPLYYVLIFGRKKWSSRRAGTPFFALYWWITVPVRPATPSLAFSRRVIRAVRPGALSANSTAACTLGSMEPGAKWPRSM